MSRAFNRIPRKIDYHLRTNYHSRNPFFFFVAVEGRNVRRTLVTFAHLHHVTAARHPYINTDSTKHLQFGSFCKAPQKVWETGRYTDIYRRFRQSVNVSFHFRDTFTFSNNDKARII